MISLNQAKVNGVLFVFLYQNRMNHIGCAPITGGSKISVKQTLFPSQEWMTVSLYIYHYKVMPFGMKNSPGTFKRLINTIIAGIEHCEAYMDDAIIYNDEWNHHLGTIKAFFDKLSEAKPC